MSATSIDPDDYFPEQILKDVEKMVNIVKTSKFYGPYYVAYYDKDKGRIVEFEVDENGEPHEYINSASEMIELLLNGESI